MRRDETSGDKERIVGLGIRKTKFRFKVKHKLINNCESKTERKIINH